MQLSPRCARNDNSKLQMDCESRGFSSHLLTHLAIKESVG